MTSTMMMGSGTRMTRSCCNCYIRYSHLSDHNDHYMQDSPLHRP